MGRPDGIDLGCARLRVGFQYAYRFYLLVQRAGRWRYRRRRPAPAITAVLRAWPVSRAAARNRQPPGILKRTVASNLLNEEVIKIIATDGQVTFTGLTLYTTDKINVYRNGVRIDFTVDNATTITIEPEATCYAGDEIRIVQLY